MKGQSLKKVSRLLRGNATETEKNLWESLRSRRFVGYKFRRQQPLGNYVVDFCCLARKLVIELDGGQHGEQEKADAARTEVLNRLGFRVLRFWDNDVFQKKESVLQEILKALEETPSPQPSPLQGEGAVTPFVVWFTGLSGAGKTTLAERVHKTLKKRGLRAEILDGDALRRERPGTGFTREEREAHIKRAGRRASELERSGVIVLASLISPYASSRKFARELCKNFVEVHVSTPLEVCERRDPKGLYKKARNGQIPDLTGIGDPYEPPDNCELTIDTANLTENEAFSRVMDYLDSRFLGKIA